MSNLKHHRNILNITQEELSEKSGISIRTIQRIESGIEPKGKTLKILAASLQLDENELKEKKGKAELNNVNITKAINLSALPFTIIPPLNILIPLLIMLISKDYKSINKQLITTQIIWLIFAGIIFMLGSFVKKSFDLGSESILFVMIFLVVSNVFIILSNAIQLDKNKKLQFNLGFNII